MGYLLAKGDFLYYLCIVIKKQQDHGSNSIAKTHREKNRLNYVF